jgi:hypothetical protein
VGDPTSGLAAMRSAGFIPAFSPSGLVCQINGKPDVCPRTPPTTAYWSYWHATPGGSWTYSSIGAGSYNPAPGAVEGWSFGAGQPPSIAPPAAVAPAPAPGPAPPSSSPPAAPQPSPSRQGTSPAPGSKSATAPSNGALPGTGPGGSASGEPGTGQAPPDAAGAGGTASGDAAGSLPAGAARSSTPSDASPARDHAEPPAADGGIGRALRLVAGVVLVGGLGWLAFWTARRRSRGVSRG